MAVRLLPPHAIDVASPREPEAHAPLVAGSDRDQADGARAVPTGASDSKPGAKLVERVPTSAASAIEAPPRVEQAAAGRSAPRSTSDAAPASESDYLFGARLDPGPRPLGDIQPEYPESANLQEGKVVLRLWISEAGVVDNLAVLRAEPKGLFENAALEAFRTARFSPGMVLGTPVKSQITVEVEFLPINRGARISGRMY